MADVPKYGREMREKEFSHLRNSSTFLNHGSYGMVPTRIKQIHQKYIDQMDEHPDDWFRRKLFDQWKESRDAVAEFVNCDPDDLVFVQNATTGVNTVLSSVKLQETDSILANDHTYPACQLACHHSATRKSVECHMMEIETPINSEDDIVQAYEDFFTSHPGTKLAIIDHITSPTALLLPVKKIVDVCRKHNVLSLVDGAHAPGQVAIDLKDINADFFTGNLHKWCFAPRGCAILYVKRDHHSWLRPLVTSHFHLQTLTKEFFQQGTRDESAYVTSRHSLKFYEEIGGIESVTRYNSELLDKVTDMLTKAWGTNKQQVPKSMEAPCMRLVALPDIPGYSMNTENGARLKDFDTDVDLMELIYKLHDIQIQVICLKQKVYVRLSAQVYNHLEEYEKLASAIVALSKKNN